jgi:D-alanyl-D-alanine carboxypeptidase
MKIIYYACMIMVIVAFGCNSSNNGDNELTIIKTIEDLVVENELPGLNLSIIYDDGQQENYAYGYADVAKKTKMTPQNVMFSGSVGKTYAVGVIMQLVEEGKIDLKKKYIDYFPDNEWLTKLPNMGDITVEMLLQHTTGLPRYIENQSVWDSLLNNPDKIWTYEERMSFIFNNPPQHKAGEGWAYSDTNYILLGMLIEEITGSYYYDEVENRILIPHKLSSTYPAVVRDIINLPNGYSQLDEFFRMPKELVVEGKYAFNPQMEWTGGGMASTTSDLAKWADIYFTNKLFSEESLSKIITPNENGIEIDKNLSYGMGSFIYHTKLGNAYGHTGFVPGFVSIIAYYPEHKMAVAMQINCDYAKKKMSLQDYLDRILAN